MGKLSLITIWCWCTLTVTVYYNLTKYPIINEPRIVNSHFKILRPIYKDIKS